MKYSKEKIQSSMLLYVVTDRTWLKKGESQTTVCRNVLENGTTFLQIREKNLDKAAFKQEAVEAQAAGADYIGVGAVFATSTKKDARNLSVEKLRKISGSVDIPVVAIGGINGPNIMELSGSRVDGAAVISAIFAAEDPGAATASLMALARNMVSHG